MGQAERQQEYGNPRDFGDDLGYLKLGDPMVLNVIGQPTWVNLGYSALMALKRRRRPSAPSFSIHRRKLIRWGLLKLKTGKIPIFRGR